MKTNIVVGILLITCSAMASALQLPTQIDSTVAPSASAGGDSILPVMSPDGRFVLFASTANNLALSASNAPYHALTYDCYNVYLRDRAGNSTVLVSASLDGASTANRDALPVALSTNGQFALFESRANNLTPGADYSGNNVFVRDLGKGATYLVSVNTNGTVGHGDSYDAIMTPDGRYVAFTSAAPDLVPDDTNGIPDVFVRDLRYGATTLASPGASRTWYTMPNASDFAAVTPDGRFVAFYSLATDLVPGQALVGDIYLRDLTAGVTTWVSAQARDQFQAATGITNVVSCNPCLSDDGNYVAFLTYSNAAVPSAEAGSVFRYNRASGQTDLITTNCFVPSVPLSGMDQLRMTPDGRFITWAGNQADLTGTNTAIYLWDSQSGATTLISADTNNAVPPPSICDSPRISPDGRYVAFLSTAALTTNAFGNALHIYLRDVVAGATTLLNADTNGFSSGDASLVGLSLSPDARYVVFDSAASHLVAGDGNQASDTFLRDVAGNSTELISVRQPSLPSLSANGDSFIAARPLSQDGRYLVFASDADNLVNGDTNRMRDIFVRDLSLGTTALVSVGIGGTGASSNSYDPVISGNGRYVVFTSAATNLIATDTNKVPDVFVRDLQDNTTALVSANAAGTGEGNSNSYSATISYDGRFILFRSRAGNLSTTVVPRGADNLFLRDQQAGVTTPLTTSGQSGSAMTPDGHYAAYTTSGMLNVWDAYRGQRATNYPIYGVQSPAISPDGNRIAYYGGSTPSLYIADRTAATNWLVNTGILATNFSARFSADGNSLVYAMASSRSIKTNQVFLYSVPARTNILVSHSVDFGAQGDRPSDSPDISADGRFVAYRSLASNLGGNSTNGIANIFLYDATTGVNSLLRAGESQGATLHLSQTPIFSDDGRTLIFRSLADNLASGDFNRSADVLAYVFLYAAASANSDDSFTISWPAAPGQTFTVQYKTDLADPVWHPASGTITINGNRAYLNDTTANADRRFYRVVANQ